MSSILLGWPQADQRRGVGFLGESGPGKAGRASEPGGLISDASESHCLVVAPTGAGKGRSVVIPNLLHWPHSAVVVDVKGEAALTTARHRRAMGQEVAILDPFRRITQQPHTLNPFDWLAAAPPNQLSDNATTLSETLTGTESLSTKEPFWDQLANDFAAGLFARAAHSPDKELRQLGAVHDLLTDNDPVSQIASALEDEPDMPEFARRQLGAFLNHESDKVRPSVLSVALQHLRVFGNPLVQAAVAETRIDLQALQRGRPMTIYLVMPATRLQSHAALLRVWLAVLMGVIAERSEQPEGPTLFVLDEMAQIGATPLILQALTLMRGYGLRVMAVVQSLAQLQSLWGRNYQTVVDNCGTLVTFGQTRPVMAHAMAELLGDLPASRLMQLPPGQLAINRVGQGSVIARKLDYLNDTLFAGRFDTNPFYDPPAARA